MGWLILVLRRNLLLALGMPILVLVIAGVTPFNPLDSAYLQNSIAGGSFFFPNTYETITEIARVPLFMLLQNTSGVEMGLLGILGLRCGRFGTRYSPSPTGRSPFSGC